MPGPGYDLVDDTSTNCKHIPSPILESKAFPKICLRIRIGHINFSRGKAQCRPVVFNHQASWPERRILHVDVDENMFIRTEEDVDFGVPNSRRRPQVRGYGCASKPRYPPKIISVEEGHVATMGDCYPAITSLAKIAEIYFFYP